jgi:hypothetical protein
VTGYQGGEINTVDGYMTVRQSDAHAWAEVWLKNRGWTRVDPTAAVAPERIRQNLTSAIPSAGLLGGLITLDRAPDTLTTVLRGLRHNWDAMTNSWNQWVLNYTPDRQRNLIQSLGFDNVDWRTLVSLMLGLGALTMAAIALPLMKNRQNLSPVDRLYQSLCQRMARYGCAPAIYEGPRAYAARLASGSSPLTPSQQAATTRFLLLYEAIRYGAHDTGDTSQNASAAHIAKLKLLLAECK